MKNFFKFYLVLTPLLLIGAFLVPQNAGAVVTNYQTITLSPGWNIISTPKVLSSHEFSVAETSDNFDIYLLDPTSLSGWQTLQGAGQTEFQPLFAYFINNKTGQNQTLQLNYNFNLTPAQRLFQRTLHQGWNAIGIASPDYAISQGVTSVDTNNPDKILHSFLVGDDSIDSVIDFTNGNANLDSPKITDTWLSKTSADMNTLNDFRELKGYGIFVTNTTSNYNGSQNLSLSTQYTLTYNAGANGSITGTSPQIVTSGSNGTAVTAVAAAGYHFVDWSDGSTTNPRTDTNVVSDINVTANFGAITSGTLAITKMTSSPSGNIVDATSNAVLAKYELVATGERIKIQWLRISITTDNVAVGKLRNGAVYANGVQIGSTTDLEAATDTVDITNNYTTFNFGSSLIVDLGSPVTLEVRADIYDNDGTNTSLSGNTVLATIVGGNLNNALGMVTSLTIDTPSSDVSANTLTVATGGITLSKYTAYTNQNAVVPLTNFKLAHFTLTANATEAVNINTIEVDLNSVVSSTNNLYVKLGNNTTSTKSTVGASNNWSVNYTLSAGTTIDVIVYGDVNSSATGTGVASVLISGTTASSATSVNTNNNSVLAGQTITFVTGSLTTAVDGSTPLNQAVAGNQSVTAGKFKFTASNDSYTIKELRFTVAGDAATSAVINSLNIKDGSTVLATIPYNSTSNYFNATGLNVVVPANTSKVLTVGYNLATPYTDGTTITTGKNAQITLSYVKVADSQGTESEPTANRTANYIYIYKTVPTFTASTITGQGANLVSGSAVEIYKLSVAANTQGSIALKQLKFAVAITDGGTESNPTINAMSFFRGSTNITSSVHIQDNSGVSLEGTTSGLNESNATPVYITFDTEEVIPAGTTYTYTLKGTPSGFMGVSGDTDSVVTTIAQDITPAGVSAGTDAIKFYLDATSTAGIQTLNATAAGAGTGADANAIWSDNSGQLHDYTYTGSSSDWFNGYLIDNFPLNSIGINYNN